MKQAVRSNGKHGVASLSKERNKASAMLSLPSKASRISSVVATSASTSPFTLDLSGDALAATPGKAPAAEPWIWYTAGGVVLVGTDHLVQRIKPCNQSESKSACPNFTLQHRYILVKIVFA